MPTLPAFPIGPFSPAMPAFPGALFARNAAIDPNYQPPCSKQALFFTNISTSDSAWVAIGAMIPIMLFSGIIIFITASGGSPRSKQRRRYIISTILLGLIAVLAFFINTAFMHMKDCGSPKPDTLAGTSMLSIFLGNIAAGVALIAWIIDTKVNIRAWRKERACKVNEEEESKQIG
jgi:hypothetical protein